MITQLAGRSKLSSFQWALPRLGLAHRRDKEVAFHGKKLVVRFEGPGADASYRCVAALSHPVANRLTDRTRWEYEIEFDG